MAITAVDMGVSIQDTSNVSTYASGSFTPVANRLYLCCVVHSDAAPEATVPTIATTTGLNFVQIGSSVPFDTIASNIHRLTIFSAMKPSGLSTGTYTVTFGDASTGCAAFLIEFDGVETTGTDGANAILQPTSGNADATANPHLTMGAFSNVNNGGFAVVGHDAGTVIAGAGTLLPTTPLSYSTPASRLAGAWAPDNQFPSFTLASCDWAMFALEIVAAIVFSPSFNKPVMQAVNRASTY